MIRGTAASAPLPSRRGVYYLADRGLEDGGLYIYVGVALPDAPLVAFRLRSLERAIRETKRDEATE